MNRLRGIRGRRARIAAGVVAGVLLLAACGPETPPPPPPLVHFPPALSIPVGLGPTNVRCSAVTYPRMMTVQVDVSTTATPLVGMVVRIGPDFTQTVTMRKVGSTTWRSDPFPVTQATLQRYPSGLLVRFDTEYEPGLHDVQERTTNPAVCVAP